MKVFWDRKTLAELRRAWRQLCPKQAWRKRVADIGRAAFLGMIWIAFVTILGALASVVVFPAMGWGRAVPHSVVPGWTALTFWLLGMAWMRVWFQPVAQTRWFPMGPISEEEKKDFREGETQRAFLQRFFWGVGVLLLMCSFIATAWSPWSWGLAGKVLAATLLIYGSTGFLGVFGPSHKVASRLAIKLLPYWWGILLFLAFLHQKTTSRFSFLERVQPLWDAMPHAGLVAWLMGREASGLVLACHSVVAALCFALMWRRYRNVLTGKADRPEVQVVQEPLMISQALEDEEEWLPERVTDPREMLKAKIDAETFEEAEGRCLIDRYHAFPRAPLRVLALIGVGGCLAVMLEALPREWLRVLWNQMPSEVRVSWLNWDLRWMIGLMALAAGVFLVTKMASVVWRALKFPSYFAMRCLEEAMGQPAWVWLPLDLQRAARWHRGWANVWIWRGLQVHAWVWGGFLVVGYCFWLLQRWLPEPDSLFVFPRFAKVLVLIGLEVVGYGIFRWWHSVVEFRAAYRDAEVGRSGWI